MNNNISNEIKGFSVKSNFFGNFKLGDNVLYNLETIKQLYILYNNTDDYFIKRCLAKPITIILVSLIEAVLYDFHQRIKTNILEGVLNVSENIGNYVRSKKIDELQKYITSAEKHDFFNLADTNFYKKLTELRHARNRIHMQNAKNLLPLSESSLFTEDLKVLAEKCTEKVVKTMNKKYPRDESLKFVSDMFFPWDEHFD